MARRQKPQEPDREQIAAAQALVGRRVRWASAKPGDVDYRPGRRVTLATADGMVEVEGYSGRFAPHLFHVVEDAEEPNSLSSPDTQMPTSGSAPPDESEKQEVAGAASTEVAIAEPVTPAPPECVTEQVSEAEAAPAAEILAAGEGEIVTMTPAEMVPEPPKQQRLPIPGPPFDLEAAAKQIEAKERSATGLWADYDRVNRRAKDLKKQAEAEDIELHALIRELRDRREEAFSSSTMAAAVRELATAAAENPEAKKPGCAFERETGAPCPICRDRKPGDENRDEPANPLHPMHEEAARDRADAEALQEQLRGVDVYVDFGAIYSGMTAERREELRSWATLAVGVRPDLPAWFHPHEAAEPGAERQSCRTCGCALWDAAHEATHRGHERTEPYRVGALIDNDCEGEPEVEAARPTKKRGAKKGRKKHEPEKIAAEQRQAGAIDDVGYPEAAERGLRKLEGEAGL